VVGITPWDLENRIVGPLTHSYINITCILVLGAVSCITGVDKSGATP